MNDMASASFVNELTEWPSKMDVFATVNEVPEAKITTRVPVSPGKTVNNGWAGFARADSLMLFGAAVFLMDIGPNQSGNPNEKGSIDQVAVLASIRAGMVRLDAGIGILTVSSSCLRVII